MAMKVTVFYSWQSDSPHDANKDLIAAALERAAQSLKEEASLGVEPAIDRDTHGVSGAPDIAATIFAKITAATCFVADVTIIQGGNGQRAVPNPNVMIELGYAVKCLGWSRVLLIQNVHFGLPDLLPFDLRARRVLTYTAVPGENHDAAALPDLQTKVRGALRAVLVFQRPATGGILERATPHWRLIWRPLPLPSDVAELMPELLAEMRRDVADDKSQLIREFAIIPKRTMSFSLPGRRFIYFTEDHPGLEDKVKLLLDDELITDVSVSNVPIYRFNDHLYRWLRHHDTT